MLLVSAPEEKVIAGVGGLDIGLLDGMLAGTCVELWSG